jgi:hypothetical protein
MIRMAPWRRVKTMNSTRPASLAPKGPALLLAQVVRERAHAARIEEGLLGLRRLHTMVPQVFAVGVIPPKQSAASRRGRYQSIYA